MNHPTRSLIALSVAAVTATGVVACAPVAEEPVDRTLVVAVDGLPIGSLDPAQVAHTGADAFLLEAVSAPLFSWDGAGQPLPGVATEYIVSDDKMSVDITLRDDVIFNDGTRMNAAGVEEYFDHLLQSEGYVFGATAKQFGAEFTATGEYTLQLTTTTPVFHPDYYYSDVIRLLFGAPVLSLAALDDPERAMSEPLGAGPYLIEEAVPEVEVTLTRNPDYWNPEAYPYDTVILKLLADPTARLNALKSGQVDAAVLLTDQAAEAKSSGLRVQTGALGYYTLLVRDPEGSTLEPLRDVRVRQAMMLAFDRAAIAETIDQGYGRVSSQAFIEGQAEYVDGGDDRFGYDSDAARDLMADAGYADGFDVTIPTLASDAGVQPIVEQSLRDIGILVTFEQLPDLVTYFAAIMGGEYPLSLMRMGNSQTLRLLDEEFAGFGRIFDQNDVLDELLELIRYGDQDESAEASQELGELLLDEAWYIPFSRPADFWGSASDVEVTMNDTIGIALRDIRPAE